MGLSIRSNNQLLYLFSCNLAILFVGMGLFPVLPLYAARLGADSTLVGLYLALTYVSITLGTMAFGWLAARLPHRSILAAAGLSGILALALMGQVAALWQLIVLTGVVWFAGGLGLTMVSILTGLSASRDRRGWMFGLISLSTPLAAMGGGAVVSQLIAWKGYPAMFAALGAVWIVLPLAAWRLENRSLADRVNSQPKTSAGQGRMGRAFYLMIMAFTLSAIAVNVGRLGTSLSMHTLDFSPSSVASTATVSGLIAIPVVLLLGPLSDRLNRRHILAFSYLLVGAGVVTLAFAAQLWHFWLAATLLLIARCVNGATGSALATDMLTREQLVRGLSWLNSTAWASGILTFALGGYLINRAGAEAVYVAAGVLAVAGAIQLEWRYLRPTWRARRMVEGAKRITQTQLSVLDIVEDAKRITQTHAPVASANYQAR